MKYSMFLVFLVLPYFFFFTWFEKARLSHKQHKNIFKLQVVQDSVMPKMRSERQEQDANADSGSLVQLKKSQTLRVKANFKMSFNSSDIEAYQQESPIPVLKQAYLEYQRNKRKASMRRSYQDKIELKDLLSTPKPKSARPALQNLNDFDEGNQHADGIESEKSQDNQSKDEGRMSEVKLILVDEPQSVYDNPNRKLIYAHEKKGDL